MANKIEPDARLVHAAFASGQNMVVWAGRGCRSDVLETFSTFSLAWREAKTLQMNDAPECLYAMAFAGDSNGRLYSFGGRVGGSDRLRSDRLINSVYCLDTNLLECREIVPATGTATPRPRDDSAMVHFNRQLIVHGGDTDDGISSDLLIFHLDSSEDCKVMCHVYLSPVDLEHIGCRLCQNSLLQDIYFS